MVRPSLFSQAAVPIGYAHVKLSFNYLRFAKGVYTHRTCCVLAIFRVAYWTQLDEEVDGWADSMGGWQQDRLVMWVGCQLTVA